MLNEQHMPRSVGNILKIEGQEIFFPFHEQLLIIDIWSGQFDVTFLTSKQGNCEYQSNSNSAG